MECPGDHINIMVGGTVQSSTHTHTHAHTHTHTRTHTHTGADYKAVTLSQNSALVLATYACSTVKGSDPRLVDLLACRGVDVNKRDDQGNSALSIAALYGRADIISMLLEYGAFAMQVHNITSPEIE